MSTRTEQIEALENSIQETDEIAADLADDFSELQSRVDDLENADEDGTGAVADAIEDLRATQMLHLEMKAAEIVLANSDIWGSGASWGPELSPIHTAAKRLVEQRVKFAVTF